MASHDQLTVIKDSIESLQKNVCKITENLKGCSDEHHSIVCSKYSVASEINEMKKRLTQHQRLLDNGVEKALKPSKDVNKPILVQLVSPQARIPLKATIGSAGFDLHAVEQITVQNDGKYHTVKTGIVLQIPSDFYGKISPRSGLAREKQIEVFEGTIDSDFRKEISVLLKNNSDFPYEVAVGDRIAQILFIKIHSDFTLHESLTLDVSNRGGFGSTGK